MKRRAAAAYKATVISMLLVIINIFKLIGKYPHLQKVARFVVSGGLAGAADLTLLFVLTEWLDVWYVISASLAFIAAFFISFFLQKFWAFRNTDQEGMPRQMAMFFGTASTGLAVVSGGIYLLVEYVDIHYLLAQIILSALVGMINFLIYNHIIFRIKAKELTKEVVELEHEFIERLHDNKKQP